eukprot:TRINITY_DN45949_c0_g1_i1.p1 TRINITY_DN45949_c0_g1~~TRINITY_DN45949_c0_g1_i1.p1  ORF type:complete len:109 (+),score=21.99 TRINITY_DN45949_c0_g1_i1:94-420(+)
MLRSLVGSEMCIRDRQDLSGATLHSLPARRSPFSLLGPENPFKQIENNMSGLPSYSIPGQSGPLGAKADVGRKDLLGRCLLYTSDAADEEDSVALGGRRFIKTKHDYA